MATLSCLNKNHRAASNVCDRFAMACERYLFDSDGGIVLPQMDQLAQVTANPTFQARGVKVSE